MSVVVIKYSSKKHLRGQVCFSVSLLGSHSSRNLCSHITPIVRSREARAKPLLCSSVLNSVSPRLHSSEWCHHSGAESAHINSQVTLGCVHLTGDANHHRD